MWAVGRPSKDAQAEPAPLHCAPFRLRASLLFMSYTFQSSRAVVDHTLCFVRFFFYPLASTRSSGKTLERFAFKYLLPQKQPAWHPVRFPK